MEVRLNDYLDIICPHYEEGSVAPHAMERYTLYLVDLEEYQACKARSKEQIRWECDKPSALHGPEKFSEKFQRFTPFTLGKEFKEGHSYYYICECPGGCVPPAVGLGSLWGFSPSNSCLLPAAKPIHHHGETCLKLKVTVLGKGSEYLRVSPCRVLLALLPPRGPGSSAGSAFPALSHGGAVAPCQPRLWGWGRCQRPERGWHRGDRAPWLGGCLFGVPGHRGSPSRCVFVFALQLRHRLPPPRRRRGGSRQVGGGGRVRAAAGQAQEQGVGHGGHSRIFFFPPPADDAAAHVLRSVGQNSAMRASSPFTFISLLLPLLVPQGL